MTESVENPPSDDRLQKSSQKSAVKRKSAKSGDNAVGLPMVLLCSGIATLLGITGGAVLGSKITPPASVNLDRSEFAMQTDLDSVKSSLQDLETRMTTLETAQSKRGPQSEGKNPDKSLASLKIIESRLAALERSAAQNIALKTSEADDEDSALEMNDNAVDIEAKNDRSDEVGVMPELDTETTNSQQSANIQADLDAFAQSLKTLEDKFKNQSGDFVSEAALNALKRRVKKLEDEFEKPPLLIPPFPREAVMDAIAGKSEKSASWMSGLLGDEVRVVDAEIVKRLDRIEKFVEAGDINAIGKEVSYLPTETKPVIEAWLRQFEQSK